MVCTIRGAAQCGVVCAPNSIRLGLDENRFDQNEFDEKWVNRCGLCVNAALAIFSAGLIAAALHLCSAFFTPL